MEETKVKGGIRIDLLNPVSPILLCQGNERYTYRLVWEYPPRLSLDFGLRPRASASGAEAVILGCTKLGMLVSQEDSEVPSIDTSIAHVHAAVDLSLADE